MYITENVRLQQLINGFLILPVQPTIYNELVELGLPKWCLELHEHIQTVEDEADFDDAVEILTDYVCKWQAKQVGVES